MAINQKTFILPEYEVLDKQMKKRFDDFLKEDRRPLPEEIAGIISDIIDNPGSRFRIPVGKDAEYIISLHSKMNETEWQNSSIFKELDW